MELTTRSAIEISESLSTYLFCSYIHEKLGIDPSLEHYMKHVKTGKYSIADIYISSRDTAIEVKSVAHGNAALKGVIQASMYKEQCRNSMLFMQKPQRKQLRQGIEMFAASHGVGVVYLDSVPSICDEYTIKEFTGGCPDPFNVWKRDRYSTTKRSIIGKSKTDWAKDYLDTIEEVINEHDEEMFDFAVKPDETVDGFYQYYSD